MVQRRAEAGSGHAVLFQLVSDDSDEREIISSDATFGAAQRDGWFLSVKLVAALPPIAVTEPEDPIDAVDYSFIIADSEEAFSLRRTRGQKVLDARKAIQDRFGIAELAHIELLFRGKGMSDAFVLDRQRIGTKQITVTIRDRCS
jgi:hypothetical protein